MEPSRALQGDSTATNKTLCQVCGDKALGFYNFNAITCESCKAFFRRNAYKEQLQCHFDGHCKIDLLTRRVCTACRLKKCFAVGMKKEYIMSEAEKLARRNKIEENREKLLKKLSQSSLTGCRPSTSLEPSDLALCDSASSSDSFGFSSQVSAFDLAGDDYRNHLNYYEKIKLDQLLVAHAAIEPASRLDFKIGDNIIDVLKFTEFLIRNIIKMAKRIPGFKKLCQEDQIALLKGGATEIIILRSTMSLNLETESWENVGFEQRFGSFSIKLSVLKQANETLYEAHKGFIASFPLKWRKDLNVMVILMAIVLFSPQRPNIIQHELIRLEQQTYIHLLKRYLSIVTSTADEAEVNFILLMNRVSDLRTLNEEHVKVYLDANPEDIGPLLVEIFHMNL